MTIPGSPLPSSPPCTWVRGSTCSNYRLISPDLGDKQGTRSWAIASSVHFPNPHYQLCTGPRLVSGGPGGSLLLNPRHLSQSLLPIKDSPRGASSSPEFQGGGDSLLEEAGPPGAPETPPYTQLPAPPFLGLPRRIWGAEEALSPDSAPATGAAVTRACGGASGQQSALRERVSALPNSPPRRLALTSPPVPSTAALRSGGLVLETLKGPQGGGEILSDSNSEPGLDQALEPQRWPPGASGERQEPLEDLSAALGAPCAGTDRAGWLHGSVTCAITQGLRLRRTWFWFHTLLSQSENI